MSKKLIWASWGNLQIENHPYRKSYSLIADRFEFPVDRFGIANKLELECENIVKPPKYDLTNLTNDHRDKFFNSIEQTTEELYNIAGDKIICISYSGGVDSTLVLCAIRQHKKYKDKLAQGKIKIFLTSNSIDEYPEFFYKTILPEIPFEFLDYEKIMKDENMLLVTGDMGDYITTSSDILTLSNNDPGLNLSSNWRNILPYIEAVDGAELFLEMVDEIRQKSIFEISSVNQLIWWFSQCFTYQDELVRPYIWSSGNNLDSLLNDSKVYRFFYSDTITKFSYEYMCTNPGSATYEESKKWFKDYIVNHTKDQSYYNKIKVFSQRLSLRFLNKSQIYIQDGKLDSIFTNEKL